MTVPANHLYRVELLSESQIAQFKRDGMLVLPGVLDLDLCRRARDQMWEIIAEHRPSMQRDDPATWVPFSERRRIATSGPPAAAIRTSSAAATASTFAMGPRSCC